MVQPVDDVETAYFQGFSVGLLLTKFAKHTKMVVLLSRHVYALDYNNIQREYQSCICYR